MTIAWSTAVKRVAGMTLVMLLSVFAAGVLLHAMAAVKPVKPAKIPIQTVSFRSATLPVWVDITDTAYGVSTGYTYDIYMTNAACTQDNTTSVGYTRLNYQQTGPYSQGIINYGKYCFWVNAWTRDGVLLPATVYTTVNVTQGKQ